MTKELAKKASSPSARKPYESPRLHVHGDASRLTRSLRRLGWLSGKRFDTSEAL